MVKVTFNLEGFGIVTGKDDFILAITGGTNVSKPEGMFYAYGDADDDILMRAIITFVKKAVNQTVAPEEQKRTYMELRAVIDSELNRLQKKETPEAATSEESNK